jgi:acetylornithine deacetylase/succinyl-diaminopimelate desuccinylase-like protein
MSTMEKYLERQRDAFLGELMELCRIPSTAANRQALQGAASRVVELLRAAGAEARLFEVPGGAPVVYGEAGDGPRTLLVYNHYDVQPPEPLEEWMTDPFSPAIIDGRLYCRGASDNKGNLMARIHAVRACLETEGALPLKVKFLVEGEEESGSAARLAEFVRAHRELLRADGCLWELSWKDPRGRPVITCGVKGLCYVELTVKGARHDMHSSHASIVPNPAWRLVLALATLFDPEYRIMIDGWLDNRRALTDAEERALRLIPFDEEGFKEKHGVAGFIRGMTGSELVREYLYAPTCTICGLRSGYTGEGSKTVLPSEAVAKLDFRLAPGMTPENLLRALRRHLDARGFGDVTIRQFGAIVPAATDCGDAIVRAATAALRETCATEPVLYPVAPWSGPLHDVCGALGIPSVAFGIGNAESHDHAPNEQILVSDYFEGIRCMAAFMRLYAQTEST